MIVGSNNRANDKQAGAGTILVTGASRGLGRYLVRNLSSYREVVGVVREIHSGDQLPGIPYLAADLSKPEGVSHLTNALSEFESIDAVVHCAGGPMTRPTVSSDVERWEEILWLNFLSVVGLNAFLINMSKPISRCVLVSSDSVHTGRSSPAYCGAKAALSAYALQLKKSGVETLLLEPPAFYGEDNYWVQREINDPEGFERVRKQQEDKVFVEVEYIGAEIIEFLLYG